MSLANHSVSHTLPVILFSLLASAMAHGAGKDFPVAPPNLDEAEAKGLQRLSADELKAFFPGIIRAKRHQGGVTTKTYKPDGSADVVGYDKLSGTWRLDEKRGVYCDQISKKRARPERCYAVFSAGDGIHHFDYDITDRLHTITWLRTTGK